MDLLYVCMEHSYFKFDSKFYKILDSLPMGNQLSPLLAEIYMDNFEKTLFSSNHNLLKCIFSYLRYVDDIFCVWTGSIRQLHIFLNFMNSLNNNLQFTLEIESNKSLNFLDLKIALSDSKFNFGIFRKPTYTDNVIHASSNHPLSQKMSAFHSMIHRLLNIPLEKEEFNKELLTIKQIAKNNDYNTNIIDNILKKKEKK